MVTAVDPGIEQRVTVRETDLLEIGIVALESGAIPQCALTLKNERDERCAEGVFADLLTRAYPEIYAWDGYFLTRAGGALMWSLSAQEWNRLHQDGMKVAKRAADALCARTINDANDKGTSFLAIAAALRQARADVEAEKGG